MDTRDATVADADSVVRLRAAAFDNAIGRWLDMTGPADRIPGRIAQRQATILGQDTRRVCCDASGKVVGYSHFRLVDDRAPRQSQSDGPTYLARLEALLVSVQFRFLNAPALWTHRARLANQQRKIGIFKRAIDVSLEANRALGSTLDRYVYLELLAVLPEAQGTGVGVALLQECMDLARANGVPLYLESSVLGYPFYKRRGFEDFGQPCVIKEDGVTLETLKTVIWKP